MTPTVRAPGQPHVRATTRSGSVTVIGEPRHDVEVDGRAELWESDDGAIRVESRGSSSFEVRVPEGTDVVVGTESGSVYLRGRLGVVRATAESGGITADELVAADLRTVSGSISVHTCRGHCRANTKSGSIKVEEAGEVDLNITSGSVQVGYAAGRVRARAVSGSITIGAGGQGAIDIETMSGSVTLSLPRGCRPEVHAHAGGADPQVDCEQGHDCEIRVRAMSGSVHVRADL